MNRRIKLLEVLDKDSIERIYNNSLDLLWKKGVRVLSRRALSAFKEMGAEVDFEDRITKIPESLVKEALESCPKKIVLCGRNPRHDMHLDGRHSYMIGGGTSLYTYDLRTGERRESTKQDAADAARIVDALDDFSGLYSPATPMDFPDAVRVLHEFDAAVNNCGKHFVAGSIDRADKARYTIQMASIPSIAPYCGATTKTLAVTFKAR